MVSDEPLLNGAFKIGGSHELRFALKKWYDWSYIKIS